MPSWARRFPLLQVLPFTLIATAARAQTLDDGMLLPRGALGAGLLYTHDRWTEYWEGTLKRDNGNIGALTTQSVTWMAGYGLTRRLSVLGTLPYVWTQASQGPLQGMQGLQDLTLAVKYQLLETPFTGRGSVRAIVVGVAALPITDYTPDYQPLSIGLGSRCASGRFTLMFQANEGWFLNGSAAYSWRARVKLDRPAYYTNGQLYLTNEVAMPNVFDYTVSAGYRHRRLTVPISMTQQRTLGGADIRRQDMPFVSDRMDFVRVGGMVAYDLPTSRALSVRIGVSRIVSGRNVGQSTTLTSGVSYTLHH